MTTPLPLNAENYNKLSPEERSEQIIEVIKELVENGTIEASTEELELYKMSVLWTDSYYSFVRDGRFYSNIHPHVLKRLKL